MPHSGPVSAAIQAALHDINLLRVLVHAPTADAANSVLHEYKESLTLAGDDVTAFYNSLRNGRMQISARDLVRYYDRLQPPQQVRETREKEGEWVP